MSAIKTKNLTIRVSEDFAITLKNYAKKRFMSQANLIEYLVRKEIEKNNTQQTYHATPQELASIDEGLAQIKAGNFYTEEEVEEEMEKILWEK